MVYALSIMYAQTVQHILASADITINGARRWDITVHDDRFYKAVLTTGSLGLGESYVAGWWDCPALDEMMYRLARSNIDARARFGMGTLFRFLLLRVLNMQSKMRAFHVGQAHYDIGNDLYEAMLDKRMTYTCGYWKRAKTLDQAQEHKLDLVCKKLRLRPGQRVLDIGCGWGSFMQYAAQKYKVSCVGVTVSQQQAVLGKQRCAGLPVTFKLQDYRDVRGQFDHIVSLGMFEHVGPNNYDTYMRVAHRCLQPQGLFLLHTIGTAQRRRYPDPWIEKYIFPNGHIPSSGQIAQSAEGLFVVEDWHNFGVDYDRTLQAWYKNISARWKSLSYDVRFQRTWTYYLLACSAMFRARRLQLWQVVLSKGVLGGYVSVR